eukprot:TRINITY_DN14262_c0_g1_i1.p1 TRINITY_DN14262_c0_g1~~TRINITY_DN14262_c0_g1_i1.p1  ORF type:complete len:470 (+),score=65.61 TRINITY_DN14262_c0_g1_i1:188-1597(+)
MVKTYAFLVGVLSCVYSVRRDGADDDEPETIIPTEEDSDAEDYLTVALLELDLGKAWTDNASQKAAEFESQLQKMFSDGDQGSVDEKSAAKLMEMMENESAVEHFPSAMMELSSDSQYVSCGGHTAPSCAECGGKGMCNGNCTWKSRFWFFGSCVPRSGGSSTPVNPGNGAAPVNPGSGGRRGMDLGCGWFSCRTRTASIHFNYAAPMNAHWYYNQVVPTQTSIDTFFAITTHKYGYAGIQTAGRPFSWMGTYHQAICSTWDNGGGNAKVEKCGSGVQCTGFGGEGTGARSLWRFNWKLNQAYAFLIRRVQVGNRMQNTCWFHAAELSGRYPGGWKHISTTTTGNQGPDFTRPGAFLEQWTYRRTDEKRQGTYGPPFFSTSSSGGSWQQATSARFSSYVDPTRLANGLVTRDYISAGQASRGAWMATGGTVMASNEARSSRSIPLSSVGVPEALRQFDANRQRLLQEAR